MFKRANMRHDEYEKVWEEQRAREREDSDFNLEKSVNHGQ